MRQLFAVLLLSTAAIAQTATGGVTISVGTPGPPPPPQPQITSGAPPAGVQGNSYTFTFTACCGTPAYTWSSTGSLPPGTTLNAATGVLSGATLGTPGTYNFNITVTDSLGQTAGVPYSVIVGAASPPTITNGNPPGGTVGTPYSFTFTATGMHPPFTFALLSGSFPNGLSLAANVLSGTPTVAGTFNFAVRVTDSLSVTADSPTYTVVMINPVPVITNSIPPGCTSGNTYAPFTLTATSGTPPYTWSLSGSIPPNLSVNPTTGVISGTCGTAGTYNYIATVTDSASQTASANYVMVIAPTGGGGGGGGTTQTLPTLPQAWVNSHECDGTTSHTVTLATLTQAGLQAALTAANTQRDTDGTGTTIIIPHGTVLSGANTLTLPGPNTTTGLNSTNCIIVTSDTPATPNQTLCSHGTRENLRSPGCPADIGKLWTWTVTTTATTRAVSCNTAGTQGPPHHYLIMNGELRYDSTATQANFPIAIVNCGSNSETTEAQQPNHIHWTQNYIHGYDTPDVNSDRAFFYSMHDSSITYNYVEMIHGEQFEGQCVATQQSSRIKIVGNWCEGGAEGSMIGGGAPTIPNYIPSDFEYRGNIFTLNFAWEAISSCASHTHQYDLKNRFEIKDAQRVLIDGNSFTQSWCDGQAGFLMLLNVRACSTNGCTGGNNSVIQDITVTNNIFAHAAQAIQTDAMSDGSGNGNGQAQKGRRWLFKNNLIYDIADNTRYVAGCASCSPTPPYQTYTATISSFGAAGQTYSCALSRDATGTLATATCTAGTNAPGTAMAVGDPVKLTACSPDTGFNVGNTSVGPPVLSGAPTSLVFTFANSGAPNGTATCTLANNVGAPFYVTYDHNSIFTAGVNSSQVIVNAQSPNFRYPIANIFTNNIWATNGGNPGGIGGSGGLEGTAEEQLWDISTLQVNCNVLTGRKSSSYTTYQTGQCANSFPGNGAGGSNNLTGIVCPGGVTSSSCLGVVSMMNGVTYNPNPSDYHSFALRSDSVFAAGQSLQASDGTQRGANINLIDQAIDNDIYTCSTPCGNGPFTDAVGVFMVPSGGNNAAGCTFTQPCNGDSAGFTAAKTAVNLLPVGSKVAMLRNGVYRFGSTINFTSSDSGTPWFDLVNWFCAPFSFRTANHTIGTSLYNGCWVDADGQKIWEIKNTAGNPWDINLYDNTNIYLWITENTDTCTFLDAHCYKRQVTPIPLAPRWFSPGPVAAPNAVYRYSTTPVNGVNASYRTSNCELDNPPLTFLGPVTTKTVGYVSVAYGGDMGTLNSIIVNYHYSYNAGTGSYGSRERFYLTSQYGWSMWDLSSCTAGPCTPDSGTYTVNQTSQHSTIAIGGTASPNWICGTAQSWWFGGTPGSGGNAQNPGSATINTPQTLWRSYPGESATITGLKQIPAPSNAGSCGTNCQDWTVTLPAASWQNFEQLWYNGIRRRRPTSVGLTPKNNFGPNACPTTATNDPFLCVTAASLSAADTACGCPSGVTSGGGHCAGTQTRVCTTAPPGQTPYQCFNKYLVNSGDLNGSWHALNIGDVELLDFETWTMARMRLLSVSGGQVNFTGSTATTNDHGCQGGHYYVAENIKEQAQRGQWYLDHCPTNSCNIWSGGTTYAIGQGVYYGGSFYASLQNSNLNHQPDISPSFWSAGASPSLAYEPNWTLHIYADTSIGENPAAADIEVPQFSTGSPQVMTGNSVSNLSFTGLTFSGDNWYPPAIGLGDQQGSPNVTSTLSFTTSNFLTFDSDVWTQGGGVGITFQAGGTNNTIQNSHCYDVGGGCFRFGTSVSGNMAAQDADTDLNVPQYGTIYNNLCDHTQRTIPSGYGGCFFLGDGHHFLVSHNESGYSYTGGFELGFGLGLSTGGTRFFTHDNILSYNLCYGQPNALMADFGCVYVAASHSSACPAGTPLTGNPCNQVINMYIHDMYSNYDMTGSAASSGARGIYCDQGCTNFLAKNNLIVRVGHSGFFLNQPQISGSPHYYAQNNLIDNNIIAYPGYTNATFTTNLATGCLAKNGDNASAFTYQHNICYFHNVLTNNHVFNYAGPWNPFGAFWIGYVGGAATATIQITTVSGVPNQLILTSSTGGESHTVNLTGQALSALAATVNGFTNWSAGTTTDAGSLTTNILAGVGTTNVKGTVYADSNNSFLTAPSLHFALQNNDYWNFLAPNTLQFALCKTSNCTTPFNGTNFYQYQANGAIPACWTNAFTLTGCSNPAGAVTAAEDPGSVAIDPGFTAPGFPTDDYHYSHSFAGQGIVPFDYTQAGRLFGSPWTVSNTTPEMFPVRPVNPATDF